MRRRVKAKRKQMNRRQLRNTLELLFLVEMLISARRLQKKLRRCRKKSLRLSNFGIKVVTPGIRKT